MDRRDFLRTTGGAAAAVATAGATAATAAAQDRAPLAAPHLSKGLIELTLASAWREATAGFADNAHRLARRIEHMSASQIRVAVTPGQAARGSADMMFGTANDQTSVHPAFAFFAGLPGDMGLAPADFDGWLAVGGGQLMWDDLAAEAGMKSLLAGHTGAAPVLWSKSPIGGAADMLGKAVFARGLAGDVARGLGASPVPVSEADAVRTLGEGGIEIMEWGSLLHTSADGIPQALPYGITGGLSSSGTALSLNIALPAWTRLPEMLQTAIAAAAAEEFRTAVAEARAHEAMIVHALSVQAGVRVSPSPSPLRDAVNRVAGAVIAHTAAFDRRAERINASYMHYRAAVSPMAPPQAVRLS